MSEPMMDMQLNELLGYAPPKGVLFGQFIRARSVQVAWAQLQTFLERRTESRLWNSLKFDCRFTSHADATPDDEEYETRVREVLGMPSVDGVMCSWTLPAKALPEVLDLLVECSKFASRRDWPAELRLTYEFEWKGHLPSVSIDDVALRHGTQFTAQSVVNVIIGGPLAGGRVFIQPKLLFLGPWNSPEIVRFLSNIEGEVPFPLIDRYFKRIVPAGPRRYLARNLPKKWRFPVTNVGAS